MRAAIESTPEVTEHMSAGVIINHRGDKPAIKVSLRDGAPVVEINDVVIDQQSYRELVDLAFPWWAFWRRGKNSLYHCTRRQ
jgi:hypothetical protein